MRLPWSPATVAGPPIWTATFTLLCGSAFLASANQALLILAIPLYMHGLDASTVVIGLVLAVFSVTSVAARPFVGYWVDAWSTAGVLALGALVLGLTAFGHLAPVIWALAVLGAIRGLAWAAFNTGGYTLLAHVAPAARRGEASGYYTLFQSVSLASFPAVAIWLIDWPSAGFAAVFVLSGVLGLVAAGLGWAMPRRTVPLGSPPTGDVPGRSGASAFYDRGVLLAALLLVCVTLTHPASTAFLPLYAQERGIDDIAWYFLANAVAGVSTRLFVGRLADALGPGISIAGGFSLCLLGLFLILVASNLAILVLGGVLHAVGQSGITISTMALAIEKADPRRRGTAMGTYSAAFSTGQGIGAALSGVAVDLAGYGAMYLGTVVVTGVGLLITAANWSALARTKHMAS